MILGSCNRNKYVYTGFGCRCNVYVDRHICVLLSRQIYILNIHTNIAESSSSNYMM
jgi:hypothetical protein